jgi:hypothetical protein
MHSRLAADAKDLDRDAHLAAAAVALTEALSLSVESYARSCVLADSAWSALERGDHEAAGAFAATLLAESDACRGTWQYGNALHHGHQVLGRVAFAAGAVDRACDELLASADTPGSPQLGSFGPKLDLAADLLRAGRRDVVIAYLEKCRSFWEDQIADVDAWLATLRAGETPEALALEE